MRKYNEIYARPVAMNMVEAEGKAWMALVNRNGICEIDIAAKQGRIRKVFDEEPLTGEYLYCHTAKVGNCLFFSPGLARKIAIYDLEGNSVSYLPLKPVNGKCKEDQREAKFWNIICHGTDVYLLGYSYPAIVKIDTRTMEITYITDWVEEVEMYVAEGDDGGYFSDGHVARGETVLLPLGCMRGVLLLDFETDTTQLIKLDISMKGVGGISSADGENVWMVGKGDVTNRVICWNRQTGRIQESILENIEEHIIDPFYAPVCIDSKVILMPLSVLSAPHIYEFDLFTGKVQERNMLERPFRDLAYSMFPQWWTTGVRLKGDWLSFMTCDDLAWHECNVKTGETRHYFVSLEEDMDTEQYLEAFFAEMKETRQMISEKKMPLRYFMDKSMETVDLSMTAKGDISSLGYNIYNKIHNK